MYVLRFKRWQQARVFLGLADLNQPYLWTLVEKVEDAVPFATLWHAHNVVEEIGKLVIPKKVFDFDASTLFLIRLFGKEWDDQAEGMLVDMEDVIKVQILNDKQEVIETIRLRNPVWETHYA
jgi:hypothetical protein